MARARRAPATAVTAAALGFAVATGACGGRGDVGLLVHASLPEELVDAAEKRFEAEHAGVGLRIVAASEEETLAALRGGERVDVWWGARATTLEAAVDEGLVESWTPVLRSPFVLAFDRERTALMDAPRDWIDLFHHALREEIVLVDPLRDPDTAYLFGGMIVEALRDDDDLLRGFDWLRRLDRATGAYVSDPGQAIRRVRTRNAVVAVLPRHVAEAARHDDAPWLYYRIPESGTPMLALGAALVSGAAERGELAAEFVRMLAEEDVATASKLLTRWQPVSEAVRSSTLPDDFELDQPVLGFPLAADTIARELEGWMERWTIEVRGQG